MDVLGIDASWMPSTFEGPEFTGTVGREAALATGLETGTPVAAGAGVWKDAALACQACVTITGRTQPDELQAAAYRKANTIFQSLYPALIAGFARMAGSN